MYLCDAGLPACHGKETIKQCYFDAVNAICKWYVY